MLRHLVLTVFFALWISFVIAEAPVIPELANPENAEPLNDAVKERTDDLMTDASAWGGYYGDGWGGRGYHGGGWGGHGHNGGGWGGRGYYGGGWGSGWGGRGYYGRGWGGYGGGSW